MKSKGELKKNNGSAFNCSTVHTAQASGYVTVLSFQFPNVISLRRNTHRKKKKSKEEMEEIK